MENPGQTQVGWGVVFLMVSLFAFEQSTFASTNFCSVPHSSFMFRSNQVCYERLVPMINIWLLHCWPLLPGHRENCGSCLNLVSPPDFLSLRWMELSLSRKEKMAEYRYLFIRNILCICICNRVACDSNKCVFGNQRIVYPILSRSLMTWQKPKSSYDKPEGRTSMRQKT